MNRSFCNTCGKLAPSAQAERDGKVYLVKDCPACGKTETLIASDARRYFAKRALDYGHRDRACHLECASCQHTGAPPSFAFVDVTNRCNMDCPVCCDNVPSMGFSFDPPLPYFERLFGYLAKMEPKPTVALFGGEPTMLLICLWLLILIPDHHADRCSCGPAFKHSTQDIDLVLFASRSGYLALSWSATVELSLNGRRVDRESGFHTIDDNANGFAMTLTECGYAEVFAERVACHNAP